MKVICDVCGTTFPETATHCPICGCAKSPAAQTIPGDDSQASRENTTANTYARGGRFSEKNVQRNNRNRYAPSRNSRDYGRQNEKQSGNKALIAVVIILLLAIVSVVVYIAVNLILNNPNNLSKNSDNGQSNVGDQIIDDAERIPCTSVQLGVKLHEFVAESDQLLLSVQLLPENTTDKPTFVSSDPTVATVDTDTGMVRPGTMQGEAIITVTCGDVEDQCKITSKVGDAPVVAPPEPPAVEIPAGFVLTLNRTDFTVTDEGFVWDLLKNINTMGVSASDITWTSSDPAVATVENGKVKAVNRGNCIITATIGSQTATCQVRCNFDAAPVTDYELSKTSVTIAKGETFQLYLKNKVHGNNIQGIQWQVSKAGIVSVSGNNITGGTVTSLTRVDVFVEYEGVTYTCQVFVKP